MYGFDIFIFAYLYFLIFSNAYVLLLVIEDYENMLENYWAWKQ